MRREQEGTATDRNDAPQPRNLRNGVLNLLTVRTCANPRTVQQRYGSGVVKASGPGDARRARCAERRRRTPRAACGGGAEEGGVPRQKALASRGDCGLRRTAEAAGLRRGAQQYKGSKRGVWLSLENKGLGIWVVLGFGNVFGIWTGIL